LPLNNCITFIDLFKGTETRNPLRNHKKKLNLKSYFKILLDTGFYGTCRANMLEIERVMKQSKFAIPFRKLPHIFSAGIYVYVIAFLREGSLRNS